MRRADKPEDGRDVVARLRLPSREAGPPWRILSFRLAIALACIAATTLVVWVEREGYHDNSDGEISLLDAAYYATVTLSTTGYGDITPYSDLARFTNIILVTPLRFLFLIVLVGTALETLTQRTRDDWRKKKWRKQRMHDHTLVIGFGVKGRAAAQSMVDAGTDPERIVVITADVEGSTEAKRKGFASVIGDARREEVLIDAGIESANQVIIATNSDDTSVLVTLAAKRLVPEGTKIVSAARESTNADILRASGADNVIVTAEAAGRLLSMQLMSPHAGDLIEDLLDSSRGLEMVERPIRGEELGLGPLELQKHGEMVLAVIRGGEVIRFDKGGVRVFQLHDRVVVVRQRPGEFAAVTGD